MVTNTITARIAAISAAILLTFSAFGQTKAPDYFTQYERLQRQKRWVW